MSDPVGPIGPCDESDLTGLLRLSAAQDWPHTEDDWRTVLASGEVFGHRNIQDEIISCAAMIPYESAGTGPSTSLGMIIVDAQARRQGLGQDLMKEAIQRASGQTPSPLLRLISTLDGRPLYEKYGFRTVEKLHSYRRPANAAPVGKHPPARGQELRPLDRSLVESVIALDASAFGHRRARMLQERIARAERSLVLFQNAAPVGYGLLVRQKSLANLGPLVAPDDAAALTLITGLMSGLDSAPFRIDLPARQKAIFGDIETLGFVENDVPPIMLRSPDGVNLDGTQAIEGRNAPQKHYYGIAAQAFG
ncbi:GNAT family N-acetyltransferase [Denitrobaculum tricleocarpae]|uniref:GNAT family N-acetyltransferase n=1 Tax=Denitrobaculum tricleocarpae TaxID=2591009 RepID=A0A545TP83_9PROT|nr:GNAT family N-acetyltransferase [Denitrobaculum tricleocarpae]TQV79032.1 GNAT family N-acetyltransferase [Denitrobaculum tricleocarpae]